VSGTILAGMADESVGEVFNLGYGKEFSIASIARKVIQYFGKSFEPVFVDAYKGDFPRTLCGNTKARNLLRWSPQVDLDMGSKEFLDWFAAERVAPRALQVKAN
jgi:nucleoside-diphosphate-sugar epimerase